MASRETLGKLVAAFAVVSAVILIIVAMIVADRSPRTHDAYIYAYSAGITPEVSGRIVWIGIRNDQTVRKGDVLVSIDPEPFQLRVQQADAQIASLEAQIDLTGRQVTSQGSGALAAAREEDRARQQLTLARNTRMRLEPLLGKGFVTAQQVDQAKTDERSAEAQVAAAAQQAAQAKEAIGDVESLKAQLLGARASRALAERDLRESSITAPVDGRITGFNLALGSFATQGHPLFTVVDDSQWYAVANFRETDLRYLKQGRRATVWLMGRESEPLTGAVVSLGAGVQPSGAVGPGLPEVDRNLNWVIVAQRFPVWIRLDNGRAPFLRIGATASVRVKDEPVH